jgi:hypothetical protein
MPFVMIIIILTHHRPIMTRKLSPTSTMRHHRKQQAPANAAPFRPPTLRRTMSPFQRLDRFIRRVKALDLPRAFVMVISFREWMEEERR